MPKTLLMKLVKGIARTTEELLSALGMCVFATTSPFCISLSCLWWHPTLWPWRDLVGDVQTRQG